VYCTGVDIAKFRHAEAPPRCSVPAGGNQDDATRARRCSKSNQAIIGTNWYYSGFGEWQILVPVTRVQYLGAILEGS
jgi:hypothetical protein